MINQHLQTGYLNYYMKWHKSPHAAPHKLRHTEVTLVKLSGLVLKQISNTFTHRDTNITRIYVNTPYVIQMLIDEITYCKLSQNGVDRNDINSKKRRFTNCVVKRPKH